MDGITLGHVGVWRWKVDTDELEWTGNLEQIHKLEAGSFDGNISTFQREILPDDAERVWEEVTKSVRTGEPYKVIYRISPKKNVDPVWIESRGGMITIDGTRYLTGVCSDVSARIKVEVELRRRLRHQEAIEKLGTFALAAVNLDEVCKLAVKIAAETFDVPLTKILRFSDSGDHLNLVAGVGWKDGLVGSAVVGIETESQAGYTLSADRPVIVRDLLSETRFSGPALLHDHNVRSGMSVTIAGTGSRPYGVFGIHTNELREFDEIDANTLQTISNIVANIARQKKADEQSALLMREVAHRSNNLLQIVSVIAGQTFVGDADPSTAQRGFRERLASIARANELITRSGWAPTQIIELVRETLKPFVDRISLNGRDILLPPQLCFDLGLVLFELATNSLKYGTLGKDKGEIQISWQLLGEKSVRSEFELVWQDPGSQSFGAVKTGFGSKLKKAIIEQKWGGVMTIDRDDHYRFSCRIGLPSDYSTD